jgi:hypothetical protein
MTTYLTRQLRHGFAARCEAVALPRRKLAINRLGYALTSHLILLAVLLLSPSLSAQQIGSPTLQEGVNPPRGVYVIRNARIITVAGTDIESGAILIRDGMAVGTNIDVPSEAKQIDASGMTVFPGMIDAGTSLGLVEVGQGANGTVDLTEVGDLNPNAKAVVSVNPHSAHVGVTRVDGVTTGNKFPANRFPRRWFLVSTATAKLT